VGSGGTGSGGIVGSGGTGRDGAISSDGDDATSSDGPGDGTSTDAGMLGPDPSAGCGTTSSITSSQYNNGIPISIDVNDVPRRYVLNVPTNYDNGTPYRLVIAFHSLDSNDKQVWNQGFYKLLDLSNDTTIFVAPNGESGGTPCEGDGWGETGCGWSNPAGIDMALTDAVVGQIEANFCVDRNRIFATGWDYGASMSYEVGCQRPLGGATATWGVRGIAIYAGVQMSGSCKPSIPIGFYASHGFDDSVLAYGGGVTLAQSYGKTNGCTWATPTPVSSGAHICTHEADCKPGYPVEFCSFDGGHTPYPDNGVATTSWGPAEVWGFISQF
jgi:poly(3-hydroxybutyrate) depolymerase